VLIPISAPNPYLNPSANLVETLMNTPAEFTEAKNCSALIESSVIIVSVCPEPYVLM
jgi:hypothetical protein